MISDVVNEGVILGFIYRNSEILDKYYDFIIPKFDFTNEEIVFFYEILSNAYIENGKLDDISINIYISQSSDFIKSKWDSIQGLEKIKTFALFSESYDTFQTAYKKLKTYNVLRHLDKQGFNVKDNIDVLKTKEAEDIVKIYEKHLLNAMNYIKGINDSELIGNKIINTYEKLKKTPEIGLRIPFPIVNTMVRGWRLNTVIAHAMHSGFGKSRFVINALCSIAIVNKTPVLLCVNEQDRKEVELMILTSIANNVFGEKYNQTVEESDIARGLLKGDSDKMVVEAAKYIQDNSQLHLYEMQSWDLNTIKMILKRHKMKGIDYAVIDTFKAMRGLENNHNMSDWMQFVYTAEKLKSIVGSEKKGGLNMGLWITLQMTDESLASKNLTSLALATGKQVKHHLDYLIMFRPIMANEKEKVSVRISTPNNIFNGQIQPLERNKLYYIGFVDKNRGGRDKQQLVYEVNKGQMIFKELGYLIKNY